MINHNLGTLGLALLAMLAPGAVAAAGAQAEEPAGVTLESGEGKIDATQNGAGTFTRATRAVTCTEGNFFAFVADRDTEITTAEPEFGSCEGPLGLPATVDMGECHFAFALTGEGFSPETFTAMAALECPDGGHTTITIYNGTHETGSAVCQYTTIDQTGLTTVDLTNEFASEATPKDWVKAHVNLTGIDSIRTHGSSLVCGPLYDAASTLEAEWELKGTSAAAEDTGLTVSTHIE